MTHSFEYDPNLATHDRWLIEYTVTRGFPGISDAYGAPITPPEPPEVIVEAITDSRGFAITLTDESDVYAACERDAQAQGHLH